MKKIIKRWRLIQSQNDGTTIIEFAIVAPLLFLLLMGIIELCLVLFVNEVLEGATNIGARIGKVGFSTFGVDRKDYIRNRINELSGGFLEPNLLVIDMKAYSTFEDIGKPEPCLDPPQAPCPGVPGVNFTDINGNNTWDEDRGKADDAGSGGDVVLFTTTYTWHFFTPMVGRVLGDDNGDMVIRAVTPVRNENF